LPHLTSVVEISGAKPLRAGWLDPGLSDKRAVNDKTRH